MEIKVLGAAREVGRSAISVRDESANIIMDYGIKLQENEDFPEALKNQGKKDNSPKNPLHTKNVSAVFLSHAHLDHCGALPMLYKQETPPLYTTALSLELANLMIKDSMKIAKKEKYKIPFGKKELEKMNKTAHVLDYNQPVKIGNFTCALLDAGHIPGSAGVFLKHKTGRTIFYTGDINTIETELLKPCSLPEKADILIIESTYGEKLHPDRTQEKANFLSEVELSVNAASACLIPVFALGRSQEVLLMLEKYSDSIAIDGMAKDASEIMLKHRKCLKDPKRLSKILDNIAWIYDDKEREIAVKRFPVIVTTAGMMSGGPVLFYLRNIKSMQESKILFTGYIIEDTPAKNLLKTNVFRNQKEEYNVLASMHQYDFSAHADKNGLMDIIKRLNPEHVICVHGDSCEEFAKNIMTKFSLENLAIGKMTEFNKDKASERTEAIGKMTDLRNKSAISAIKTYAPRAGEVIKI